MTAEEIISLLPYTKPFLFVDDLEQVDKNGVIGTYTYPPDSFFYKGHFIGHPVTPGVILTETMAQIGLACFGIFLSKGEKKDGTEGVAMVYNEIEYFMPVFPSEKVWVTSQIIYFRFGKLKCQVEMRNEKNELVCKGKIAGMISTKIKNE